MRHAAARYVDAGRIALARRPGPPRLDLALAGPLDARLFARIAPRLERLLRHTHSTLTLRIEALHAQHTADLQRLLARLARHGDRVSIVVHESLRSRVAVDSSVFDLVLDQVAASTARL